MKDLPLSPFDRLNNKLDRGERYVSCPKTQEVETAKGSTQELYNHLKTTYGTPRFGTTRAVFKVDAHTVIKLAFVERGLEQNQNEIAMAAYTSTVDLRDHDFLQHFEVADGKVPTAPTRVKHTPGMAEGAVVLQGLVVPLTDDLEDLYEELDITRAEYDFWIQAECFLEDGLQLGIQQESGRLLAYDF